jgi:hypothetical protein
VGATLTDTWNPANQLEQRLREVLQGDDKDAYFRLVGEAELFVPLPPGEADSVIANHAAFTWPTSTREGRTHVLAYTSQESARVCLGPAYEQFVRMTLADMAHAWPNQEWWLAVNSGLPIEGYLPAWFIAQLTGAGPVPSEAVPVPPVPEQTGRPPFPGQEQSAPPVTRQEYGAPPVHGQEHGAPSAPGQEHGAPPVHGHEQGAPPAPGHEQGAPPVPGQERGAPQGEPIILHIAEGAAFTALDDEERALHEMAVRGDAAGFLRALLNARQIWVPTVEGADPMLGPGRPGFRWLTGDGGGGRVIVPLFTGPGRMREAMGGHPFVLSDLPKVLRFWPDAGWELVVNAGTAIGASIPGEHVTGMSARVDAEAAAQLANGFPAQSDAERQLFDVRGDADMLVKVLLDTTVFLPVWSRTPPTVQTSPSDPAFPWAAVSVRGRESVLAFTSFDWMKEAVGTTGFVMPTFADLLTSWQEPSWDVSVNPGTPIELELSGEQIHAIATSLANRAATPAAPPSAPVAPSRDLVQDGSAVPGQAPVGPPPEPAAAPESLATPAAPPQTPLPEPSQGPAGIPVPAEVAPSTARPGPAQIPASIPVPTATAPPITEPGPAQIPTSVSVPTATAEPGPAQIPASIPVPTATAPSTTDPKPVQIPASISLPTATAPPIAEPEPAQVPAGVLVPAATMPPIAAPLEPQAVDQAEPRTPADGAFTIMQKVLVHAQVPWYLDKAYDRVAGFVHRVQDVIDLNTPQRLYECLGLIREGAPFTVDDPEVYVIRWAAYRAGLYRTPFGGANEDALKEWGEDGWVVEPPPFTGDGFSSGSAGSIPEYKAESFRLPHSSEMYVISSDGSERFVARYDADRLLWEKDK